MVPEVPLIHCRGRVLGTMRLHPPVHPGITVVSVDVTTVPDTYKQFQALVTREVLMSYI
jgi:hypothetical protein